MDDGHCLPCFDYVSPTGISLAVPASITAPWYVEDRSASLRAQLGDETNYARSLWKYSSTTGAAFGLSLKEARLHALNEIIERDALSLFICEAFTRGDYVPQLVDTSSNAPVNACLHSCAEGVGGFAVLLDITRHGIGIPTYLAYASDGANNWYGSGSSADRAVAASRAASELAQDIAYDEMIVREPEVSKVPSGFIARCRRLDLDKLIQGALSTTDNTVPLPPLEISMSVEQHLSVVMKGLNYSGLVPFFRTVLQSKTTPAVVAQAWVPSLERFALVLAGSNVVPGKRGLECLQTLTSRPS